MGGGGVISLPWDVFTGPAARQSLHVKSLLGAHALFIPREPVGAIIQYE